MALVFGVINEVTDLGVLQLGTSPFSNPGASLLVSAPGSNIASTSRLIQNDNGSDFRTDCETAQGNLARAPSRPPANLGGPVCVNGLG